jgi:6-phosphogluconolactonase
LRNRALTLSRRELLRAATVSSQFAINSKIIAANSSWFIYWGTYTSGGPQYGMGESKGIYLSRFDAREGKITAPELAAETVNPSWITIHPRGRFLYAVNEHVDPTGKTPGELSAFSIAPSSGQLQELNRVSSRGGMPCHVCTDRKGNAVFAANWATGSTAGFRLKKDGTLGEAAGFSQHGGGRSGEPAGPASSKTGAAAEVHCHSVIVSRDNRFLISTDTGLNKVFVYRLAGRKGNFVPHDPPFLGLVKPANPRHLAFHPNNKWAYVANEINPGCTLLRYDAERGIFEEGPVIRTVSEDFTGHTSPAEVAVHPTGRFVFVSNRGHNSIAILGVDPGNGSLTRVDAYKPGGEGPRSFTLDPTGSFLIAMMQRTNEIIPLRIDQQTGKLTPAGDRLKLGSPVCAVFYPVDHST